MKITRIFARSIDGSDYRIQDVSIPAEIRRPPLLFCPMRNTTADFCKYFGIVYSDIPVLITDKLNDFLFSRFNHRHLYFTPEKGLTRRHPDASVEYGSVLRVANTIRRRR